MLTRLWVFIMTSSNGNIFCVTSLLCGEFTGHRWTPLTKRPVTRSFDVFFGMCLNKRFSKQSWGITLGNISLRYIEALVGISNCEAGHRWRVACSTPHHHTNWCWFIANWTWTDWPILWSVDSPRKRLIKRALMFSLPKTNGGTNSWVASGWSRHDAHVTSL